jgi:hypothetical protein
MTKTEKVGVKVRGSKSCREEKERGAARWEALEMVRPAGPGTAVVIAAQRLLLGPWIVATMCGHLRIARRRHTSTFQGAVGVRASARWMVWAGWYINIALVSKGKQWHG